MAAIAAANTGVEAGTAATSADDSGLPLAPGGTTPQVLQLLDFTRIRAAVADYCLSDEGRSAVNDSLPFVDAGAVVDLKARVGALCTMFHDGHIAPHCNFVPVEVAAKVASKPGTALEVEELVALGLWAESYQLLKKWLLFVRHDDLKLRLREAPECAEIAAIAFRIVNKDGTVRDLPELREIRHRIQKLHADIERTTAAFFQDEAMRGALQNDVPTQRDGRTVLAVRAGFKGRVDGIVHEVSGTGQTVFIEPRSLVQMNNALVEEESRYQRELLRILREATAKIHLHHGALEAGRQLLAYLDSLYARARYSYLTDGVFAEERQSGLELFHAKHPILGSKAVPIDLRIPEETRTLIITGPNTGGKTVSLKTAGLFALMNQFGLAIPAANGSGLPVFDAVWADIGDEQSIDQSLSTFSAHMRTVSAIVGGATGRSLVLLDELGSGTDPEEGCAIAMALLDHFIERGALCLVTTHHGILKNYGYTQPGVLNASVDFDKTTLSPTYRILLGIPGESHALDIASKNGLPGALVAGARNYLADERTDVSAMIAGLMEKHRDLDSMRREEKTILQKALDEQRKTDLKALQLKQKELELRQQGVRELKQLLQESRKTLENLVREVREGELTRDKTQAVKEFLAKFDGDVERAAQDISSGEAELRRETAELTAAWERADADSAAASGPARTGAAKRKRAMGQSGGNTDAPIKPIAACLEAGAAVLVLPARRRGIVLRAAKPGKWVVETDALRLTVDEHNLELVQPLVETATKITIEGGGGGRRAVLELDMRGMRLQEAVTALEEQLDAAILQNILSFSIIHGTGEGILQQGVRDVLSKNRNVVEFHYARPEQGGHGKTIVQLG
ncbi:MAG TPA: endonuclease MutS2 [Spirochaetaceae bacterium]|nr:endonuclease MutS2 [Spirochaetaceae bacterium]HAW85638.1 endonuclease MutS2 [Spirochaetaceae bacterium]HBO40583.1 endonuclease MutS2 [Spirochaetaceae bacterium]HCQ86072.1 endonuclease MutS2 [Spirochaetaceae bacterium]